MKPMFTASATAAGGRGGSVSAASGAFALDLAMPEAMGGPGGSGTNPEEMFAAGFAACFQSALEFMAMQENKQISGGEITNHVSIGENDAGPGFMLAVTMDVTIEGLSQADAEALVESAHQVCPYSNAIRGNVAVDFNVAVR